MPDHAIPNRVKPEPIDNTEAVNQFRLSGGHILHIRPGFNDERGITIAFIRRGSRITFSTAVQHRSDAFTKKMGTKTAIEHFLAGNTVTLPLRNSFSAVTALRSLAGWFF